LNFAQQSLYSRLFKRIGATLVQNDLPVGPQQVGRQGVSVVGRETRSIIQQCVPYLFLPIHAVDAVVDLAAAVGVANLSRRDDRNILMPGPGHDPSNVSQNL